MSVRPGDVYADDKYATEAGHKGAREFFEQLLSAGDISSYKAASFMGGLGGSLYQPGGGEEAEVVGPDGHRRTQRYTEGMRASPEAFAAYQAMKKLSAEYQLPIQHILKLEWQAQQSQPIPIDGKPNEGFRQIVIDAIDYMDRNKKASPEMLKLREAMHKTSGLSPEAYRAGLADTNNHDFDLIREYSGNGPMGAEIMVAYTRKVLDEKYNYSGLTPEQRKQFIPPMREVGSQILLTHIFGEERAKQIIAQGKDEKASAFFSPEEIAKNDKLREFLKKEFGDKRDVSARDLVDMAGKKMDVDVSKLLGTLEVAFGNRGVAPSVAGSSRGASAAEAARYAQVSGPIRRAGEEIFKDSNITPVGVSSWGEAMLAMSHFESSGFKSQVLSGGGTGAFGLFQFMPTTLADQMRQMQTRGLLPANADPKNVDVQGRLGAHFTLGNAKHLQANGFEVNLRNLYLSHWWGQGGVSSLLRASPDAQIRNVLTTISSRGFQQNGLTGNETVQQLLDLTNGRMANSLAIVRKYDGAPDQIPAPSADAGTLAATLPKRAGVDLENVSPLLLSKVAGVIADLKDKWPGVEITSGARTREQQLALKLGNPFPVGDPDKTHHVVDSRDNTYGRATAVDISIKGGSPPPEFFADLSRARIKAGLNTERNDPVHVELSAADRKREEIQFAQGTPPQSPLPTPASPGGGIQVAMLSSFRDLRLRLGFASLPAAAPVTPQAPVPDVKHPTAAKVLEPPKSPLTMQPATDPKLAPAPVALSTPPTATPAQSNWAYLKQIGSSVLGAISPISPAHAGTLDERNLQLAAQSAATLAKQKAEERTRDPQHEPEVAKKLADAKEGDKRESSTSKVLNVLTADTQDRQQVANRNPSRRDHKTVLASIDKPADAGKLRKPETPTAKADTPAPKGPKHDIGVA